MNPAANFADSFLKVNSKKIYFQKLELELRNQTLFDQMSEIQKSIYIYLFVSLIGIATPETVTNSILSLSRKIQRMIENNPNIKAEELFERIKAKRGYKPVITEAKVVDGGIT